MSQIYNPRNYQQYASERIIEQPYLALFLDMGLGKTISTLTAIIELLHDRFEVAKILTIAPKRVAELTWSMETAKWQHTKYLKVSKVLGKQKERIAALNADADIYIINRENVEWLVEYYGKKWPFDMVIIDESSSFKSSKAKRFRALRKVRPFIERLVELTGTPRPNSLMDLWPQIYLLDQGERLGKTITGFRERYFQPGRRNGHTIFEWVPRPGAEEAIYSKIADICVSMKAEDWLELPERIDNIIPVQLQTKTREKYKQLEKDLLLPMADADIVASNAAVLGGKLLQMANGAVYDENGQVQVIHDEKIKALDELLESVNGQPVLVFYAYQHDRQRLEEYLKSKGLPIRKMDTEEDINDWNNRKIPVLLAHPASIGHGLNLQAGSHIAVWFGLTWSLELYQQANKRLHRQGQAHNVIVHHIIAKGTHDEDVMKALNRKDEGQRALMDAVKARIEAVRRAD